MEYTKIIFYLIFVIYSIILLFESLDIFGFTPRQFLFLTNVCFLINLTYQLIQLLDSLHLIEVSKVVIDGLFKFALSLSIVVDIMFWIMYISDPNLLVEKGLVIPSWFLFSMHGSNMIFLLGGHLYIYKHYESKEVGVLAMIILSVVYTITLYSSFYFLHIEIYPFLNHFTFIQYVLFTICCAVILILVTYIQKLFVHEEKIEESINLDDL